MSARRVGVFGASGYAGLELCRLLARHPHVEVAFAGSERFAGKTIESLAAVVPAPVGGMRFVDAATCLEVASTCAIVFLATPAESSLETAPVLVERGVRVVDLSNAFRLADSPLPAAYGLPEAPAARAKIALSRLVANPGCYPTAAQLALGPLLAAAVISPVDLVVDAMSGVTGAGRRAEEAYSFVELAGNARAYKVLRHQHQPEIAEGLARFAETAVDVTFTPHLVPLARGILSTAYARPTTAATSADLTAVLREAYRGERFVRVVDSPDEVAIARVVHTNDCMIGVARAGKRVVVVSAIDNLVKGAAGQAVQNLNLMLGLDEAVGL